MTSKRLLVFIMSLIAISAPAVEDIVQLTKDGESVSEIPSTARTEALKQAIDKGTFEVISNIISPLKAEKNADVIKQKIYPESAKYIQFYKATEPVKKDEKTTALTVTMKISTAALREILDRENLLIQTDDVFTILPLIKIYDKKSPGRSYIWWKDEIKTAPPIVKDQIKTLMSAVQTQQPKGFKVIDPIASQLFIQVPERFKQEELPLEDAIALGVLLKAQIIMVGEAVVYPGDKPNKAKSALRFMVYNAANSRQLAEGIKTYDASVAKTSFDLALQQVLKISFTDMSKIIFSQLQTEFKKGTFGSQTINLVVQGDLNYQDLENLKKEVLLKIPELRTLRERSVEKGRMALEGDLVGSVSQLAKKIEASRFEKFELSVDNVATNQLDLKWSRGGG